MRLLNKKGIKSSIESLIGKIGLDRILKMNLFSFSGLIYMALASILIIFVGLLFSILINGDYESILRIGEFVIVGSGTLAILTFHLCYCYGGEN